MEIRRLPLLKESFDHLNFSISSAVCSTDYVPNKRSEAKTDQKKFASSYKIKQLALLNNDRYEFPVHFHQKPREKKTTKT